MEWWLLCCFIFVYIALIRSDHFLHRNLVALIGGHIATRSKVNSARDCTTTHGRAPIQYFLLFTLCIVQILSIGSSMHLQGDVNRSMFQSGNHDYLVYVCLCSVIFVFILKAVLTDYSVFVFFFPFCRLRPNVRLGDSCSHSLASSKRFPHLG